MAAARDVLLEAELISDQDRVGVTVAPFRLLAGLLVALVIGALVVWAVTEVLH